MKKIIILTKLKKIKAKLSEISIDDYIEKKNKVVNYGQLLTGRD